MPKTKCVRGHGHGPTLELARKLGLVRTIRLDEIEGKLGKKSPICNGTQIFDYFIVVDFEATCWSKENGPGFPSEIIEFPAVLIQVENGKLLDEFHHYVQPTENPILSNFCRDLTGITQQQVEDGMPLGTVLMLFSKWVGDMKEKYGFCINELKPNSKSATFITWSDWDFNVCLSLECKRKGLKKANYFDAWCDLRFVYTKFYGRRPEGLNGALQDVGINFEGREHSGLCDSRNTARLAHKLVQDGCKVSVTKFAKDVTIDPELKKVLFDPSLSCLISPEQRKKVVITPDQKSNNSSSVFKTPDTFHLTPSNPAKKFTSTPPLCKCGRRAKCRTVTQGQNRGKLFYSCPMVAKGCKFFSWHDDCKHKGGLSVRNMNITKYVRASVVTEEEELFMQQSDIDSKTEELFETKQDLNTLIHQSKTNNLSSSASELQYFGNVPLQT